MCVKPKKSNPSAPSREDDPGLVGVQAQPEVDQDARPVPPLRPAPGGGEDDEVVGIADQLAQRRLRLPCLVEDVEGDVGQQRGDRANPGGSPTQCPRPPRPRTPRLEANYAAASTSAVNHPAFDLGHQGLVVDLVKACLDVSVEHPIAPRLAATRIASSAW